MKYDYHVNSHRKKRFIKKIYISVVLVLLSIIAVGAAIKADDYLQDSRNPTQATTSSQTTGYFAPTTQIFSTPYFQFQTNKSWAEVQSESEPGKYVYRSLRNNLVEHELTIYIGTPAGLESTHVLPVKLAGNGTDLVAQPVSDHCKNAPGVSPGPTVLVTYKDVRFNCDADGTLYHVSAGLVGGTTQMRLSRPDDSEAVYTIFYSNVTAKPEASQLVEIISTFQTR